MSQIKLGIGLPAYGGKISAEHSRMWLEVGCALADSRERFKLVMPPSIVDVCQVDKARSILVEGAIATGCDWLVMLDADTWCEDGVQLLQMISSADRQGFQVVVGAVRRRHVEGKRGDKDELMIYHRIHTLGADRDERGKLHALDHLANAHGDLIDIDAAATACMAVSIPFVVKELERPWFKFTPEESEDLDFCRRITAAGGSIAVDRRVQTRHVNRPAVLRYDGA